MIFDQIDKETRPRECIKFLTSTPLRFGDLDQIRALAILAAAEELLESAKTCPECDGKGETEQSPGECSRCGRVCAHCKTTQHEKCEECQGSGESEWSRDGVYKLPAVQIMRLLGRPAAMIAA